MSGAVTYAGNGMFSVTMNGKTETLNMADLNAMLRMEQVEGYDQTIADQLGEIQRTNKKRKALNQLMSHMRDHKTRNLDSRTKYSGESFKLEGYGNEAKSFDEWSTEFGFKMTTAGGKPSEKSAAWDTNINAVKGLVDNVTSDSEMQMLRFRQMVDKRGTALQEAKTTLQNDKRLKDAIVQG